MFVCVHTCVCGAGACVWFLLSPMNVYAVFVSACVRHWVCVCVCYVCVYVMSVVCDIVCVYVCDVCGMFVCVV